MNALRKSPRVLHGPDGIKLELDQTEVYPDDPGQGTPALVILKTGQTATFWCADEQGEVDGIPLSNQQKEWLHGKEELVNQLIHEWTAAARRN